MKSELCRAVAKSKKPFTFHLQFHDASASFLVVLATICTSITRRCSQGCDDLRTLARVRSRLLGKRPVVGLQEESESAVDVCGTPESSPGRSAVCGTLSQIGKAHPPLCRMPARRVTQRLEKMHLSWSLCALRSARPSAERCVLSFFLHPRVPNYVTLGYFQSGRTGATLGLNTRCEEGNIR